MDNIIDFNKKAKNKNKQEPENVTGEVPRSILDITHEGTEYRFSLDFGGEMNLYVMKYLVKDKNMSPSELITCVLSGKNPDEAKEVWRPIATRKIRYSWFYRVIFLGNEQAFLRFKTWRFYRFVNKTIASTFKDIHRRKDAVVSFAKSVETQV